MWPPALLPLRTEAAVTLHLDHKQLLREMLRVSDAMHPGFARNLQQQVERLSKQKGIDLRRDLITALGPHTTLAVVPLNEKLKRVADRYHMDRALFALVLAQQVRDEESMRRVLKAGLAMVGPLPFRTVDGIRVHVAPGRHGGAAAIFDGQLVLARHFDIVRSMIERRRDASNGILKSAAFERAVRYAPKKLSAFSYVAPRPPPFPLLATGDERTRRLLRAAGQSPSDWWRAYHDLSVFSLTDAGDGLLLTWFTGLRRPGQLPTEK